MTDEDSPAIAHSLRARNLTVSLRPVAPDAGPLEPQGDPSDVTAASRCLLFEPHGISTALTVATASPHAN